MVELMNEIYHEIKCIFLYDIFYLKRYTEIHKYSVDVFFLLIDVLIFIILLSRKI